MRQSAPTLSLCTGTTGPRKAYLSIQVTYRRLFIGPQGNHGRLSFFGRNRSVPLPFRSFSAETVPFLRPVRSFWLGTVPFFKRPVINRFDRLSAGTFDRSITVQTRSITVPSTKGTVVKRLKEQLLNG